MNQYSSHWCLTIIAAIILNLLALTSASMMWNESSIKTENDETEIIDWVDVDEVTEPSSVIVEAAAPPEIVQEPEVVSEFPPLIIPPLPEIPKYVPEPLPIIETPPKPEIKQETKSTVNTNAITDTADNSSDNANKTDEDKHKKIKVISKVYPKDIVNELLEAGLINEPHKLHNGTVLVQVLIGIDGKVKRTEIKRGGGYDERGNVINTLIEMAAAKWVFEPYLDEENKPKEMPTQIEFKPEDF